MLTSLVIRIVQFSTRRAWPVIALALLLTVVSGVYVAGHFAINTDISRLLESDQPWARRDAAVSAAFPQRDQMILAVLQAPAPSWRTPPPMNWPTRSPSKASFFAPSASLAAASSSSATACSSSIPPSCAT